MKPAIELMNFVRVSLMMIVVQLSLSVKPVIELVNFVKVSLMMIVVK